MFQVKRKISKLILEELLMVFYGNIEFYKVSITQKQINQCIILIKYINLKKNKIMKKILHIHVIIPYQVRRKKNLR